MPKFYITWHMNPLETPKSQEERVKLWLSMLAMIEAEMKAGIVKDWGIAAGGNHGYGIREEANETALLANLLKYNPYISFEAIPVLNAAQAKEAIQKAVAAAKK